MPTVLYAGTSNGVSVVSSKDLKSWRIDSRALESWEVMEVAVHPGDPERVFAGTRGDGVWSSEDGGKTWKKPSYGRPGPGKVQCLTLDPEDPDTVYAGGEPIGIWVSHDACRHWSFLDSVWKVHSVELVSYPVPTVEPHVRDIAFDPQDPNTMYAALQVGAIIKSTDRGASWTLLEDGVDADVHTIVPSRNAGNRVVVATGGHDNRLGRASGKALYLSDDRGISWTPLALEFKQEYSVPLIADPAEDAILYSAIASGPPPFWRRPSGAEAKLIRSRDAGATWEALETGFPELESDFPVAIAADPAAQGRLYVGSNKGSLYMSNDRGEKWRKLDVQLPEIIDLKVACS